VVNTKDLRAIGWWHWLAHLMGIESGD